MEIKCLKNCPDYREVHNHKDERFGYKHKCLKGYFYKVNEGSTYSSSVSEEDKLIIYTDEHLKNYWANRRRCKKDYDYFYSKFLGNILATAAVIISIFTLFYNNNKQEIFIDNTNLSTKQKHEVDSIITARFAKKHFSNQTFLKSQLESSVIHEKIGDSTDTVPQYEYK